jgi:hypothetical protein
MQSKKALWIVGSILAFSILTPCQGAGAQQDQRRTGSDVVAGCIRAIQKRDFKTIIGPKEERHG